MANVTNEAAAACHGDPRSLGGDPELLPGMCLEGELGVLHDLVDHVGGHGRVDPPAHVHAPELRRLPLGAVTERPALHLELALHQLALGGHGEVLAGRHGEGAGDQPGDPARRTIDPPGLAPAMPRTRETLVTRPSLTPKTAARAPPPRKSRWWCGGVASCSCAELTGVSVVTCPHAGSVLQRNQTLTSEERTMTTIVDGVDAFHELVGKELGHSEWQPITQERVNLFADATDDHQWIHVDPERAKEGPFGVAIAHGYLTLVARPRPPQQDHPGRQDEVRRELRLQQGPVPLARPRRLGAAHGRDRGRGRRRRRRRAGHLRPRDGGQGRARSPPAWPKWSTATTADDAADTMARRRTGGHRRRCPPGKRRRRACAPCSTPSRPATTSSTA